jgi:hypothetical protein
MAAQPLINFRPMTPDRQRIKASANDLLVSQVTELPGARVNITLISYYQFDRQSKSQRTKKAFCLFNAAEQGSNPMSVQELEAAIAKLSPHEFAELMAWLVEHHAKAWDQQIEADLDAGRLNAVLAEVERECEAGLARPL